MARFDHPLQLFRLEHPDPWEVRYDENTGGVIFVQIEDGTATALSFSPLAVTGQGLDVRAELGRAAERVAVALLAETIREEENGPLRLAYGEGDREAAIGGSSRFRLWVIQRGPLALYVTQLGPGAETDTQRTVADEVVGSLEFPEIMPPTAEEFRARVMEILEREYPQVKPTPRQWAIELANEEGEVIGTVGLENLYRDCLLKSESAGALIREYLDQLLDSLSESNSYEEYNAVRGRLLPMLKSEEWVREVPGLVTTPFAPGLVMCFVVDAPARLAYVTEEMLSGWDQPLERVQEVAQDNLARMQEQVELMILRDPNGKAIAVIVNVQDGYAATRLVVPSIRDSFAEHLGDDYLIGLPNRDFLVAFTDREPETAANIIRQVKHDFQRMNHPLSTTIYRVHSDSVAPTEL